MKAKEKGVDLKTVEKDVVSSPELKVITKCDDCNRDILSDEILFIKEGTVCYDCGIKKWLTR